jgi:predicted phosphodiesterase
MKISVFSDTHLYLPFDQKKYNFLKKVINSSDRVIINGDFFDDYMITFDNFMNSPWKQLFPLLKKKKTVYVFGNHDQKKYTDKRLSLFSIKQTDKYLLKTKSRTFIFVHGHQFRQTADLFLANAIKPVVSFVVSIAHITRQLMVTLFGRKFLELRFGYRNGAIKKEATATIKDNEFIVIGHNHWAEVDEKNHFASCGAILYGFAQYLTIDSVSGEVTFNENWYNK